MRKLTVENHNGKLTLSWPWKAKGNTFLLVFAIIWNTIVFFIATGILVENGFNLFALLPLIFHISAGLFILYFAIARAINYTVVTVDHQQLKVKTTPLPWFDEKEIKSSDLEQLYLIENGHESVGSVKTIIYAVRAILKNGTEINVVSGIRDQQKGLEIERLIEEHLRIKDVPVAAGTTSLAEAFKKYFPNTPLPSLPGPINNKSATPSLGEGYSQTTKPPSSSRGAVPPPRAVPTDLTDPLANGIGSIMTLRQLDYQLRDVTQFDWENNTIDRSGSLAGDQEDTGFYSEDRGTRDRYFFEERDLSPKEFLRIGLGNATKMPQQFTNGDEKFHLRETVGGYAYPEGRSGYPVRQWLYFTTSSHTRFRVIEKNGELTVYIQEPVAIKELA